MPTIPMSDNSLPPQQGGPGAPSDTMMMMAAAMMHQEGRFKQPKDKKLEQSK